MKDLSRRRFFEESVMAAAAAALPVQLLAQEKAPAVSANEKLTVAIIGCGIRGKAHARELARLPDCDIAYVCDPDLDRADEVAALLTGEGVNLIQEYQPEAVPEAASPSRPAGGQEHFQRLRGGHKDFRWLAQEALALAGPDVTVPEEDFHADPTRPALQTRQLVVEQSLERAQVENLESGLSLPEQQL